MSLKSSPVTSMSYSGDVYAYPVGVGLPERKKAPANASPFLNYTEVHSLLNTTNNYYGFTPRWTFFGALSNISSPDVMAGAVVMVLDT